MTLGLDDFVLFTNIIQECMIIGPWVNRQDSELTIFTGMFKQMLTIDQNADNN